MCLSGFYMDKNIYNIIKVQCLSLYTVVETLPEAWSDVTSQAVLK